MPVYWSRRPIDWRRSLPATQWLGLDAGSARLPYPAVLDVVESALALEHGPLLAAAADSLAPRWSELGRDRELADPARTDVSDEGDDGGDQLVLYAASLAVSRLGSGYGSVIAIGPNPEPTLRYFLTQLGRLAEDTGFTVACVGDLSALPSTILIRRITGPANRADWPGGAPLTELTAGDRRALAIVAVSAVGAPLTAARRLGLSQELSDRLAVPGPGGERWIVPSPAARHRLREKLDTQDRRRDAAALFDAWPTEGWGYLRRAPLAVASCDRARLYAQHAAMLAGHATIGREFLQRHAAALAAATARGGARSSAPSDHRIAAHLAAARLASRLRPVEKARKEAAAQLRRARRLATDPVEYLDLTAHLANELANQRTPQSLVRGRELYTAGLQELAGIRDSLHRTRLEITMLNGLALIEYVEGANQAALDLEERAERLAFRLVTLHPTLGRWAFALVGVNTARLLTVRFCDRAQAIAKLRTALTMTRSDHHADPVRRSLAQLYFAQGAYRQAIGVLGCMYPTDRLLNGRPDEELHDRILLAVAELSGDGIAACKAHLALVRTLAARNGGDAALSALAVLTQAVAAREQQAGTIRPSAGTRLAATTKEPVP
jgi:hypothetical protein